MDEAGDVVGAGRRGGREVRRRGGRGADKKNDADDRTPPRSTEPPPSHPLPHPTPGAPRGGYRGRGGRGAPPGGGGAGPRSFDGQPPDIEFQRVLRGHGKQVTAAAVDAAAGTLYTGSQDGTVRAWALDTGAAGPVVDVGGAVDSLLLEGGWLLVGLHTPSRAGLIKAFHLATGATGALEGHAGQVLCLAAAGGSLFSGGQDATIRVWAHDAATAAFALAGVLDGARGGHAAPVQALAAAGAWLVSGDWSGALKVWDLAAAACVQTIAAAHDGVLMGALTWEGHVVTAGLDGCLKVWAPADAPSPAAPVLEAAPSYVHPPGGAASAGFGGVLALAGTADARGGAVLLASHADEGCVRVWDVPSFAERGVLGGVTDARAVAATAGGVVVVGDKRSTVKVWRWKA